MIKRAIWVHGNAVTAERPDDLAGETRIGWGSKFLIKPGEDNWFHVSIPSPVVIDDVRSKLARVFVLFKTTLPETGNVYVGTKTGALHVYDGPSRVAAIDETRTGTHNAAIDATNTWEFDVPLSIYQGLGLSIHVQATKVGLDNSPQAVEFSTIGADFV